MRPCHSFGILSGLALLGTTALLATAALAAPPQIVETRSVNYTQSDLSDPAATAELYKRIQRAAQIVCEQPFAREIDHYMEFKKCYVRAVDAAVANVDASALTAVHHQRR
ncbi:MAG: UrcA family protein [Proteobacteria bacterium]|nr:UrcA family protein [Pseudomonadota bacterium]